MDSRNRIYLAARKAILNLPKDRIEPAMEALYQGITNIEREFVATVSQPYHSDPDTTAVEPETATISNPPVNKTSTLVAAWKQIIGYSQIFRGASNNKFALSLLVTFGIGSIVIATILQSSDSNANRGIPNDSGVETVFYADLPADQNKLANAPFSKTASQSRVSEVSQDTAGGAVLYARDLIEAYPGQEFLMRIEFESSTGGPGPGFKAGFAAYDVGGKLIKHGDDEHLYFLRTVALGNRYYNETSGNYVVSGLLSPLAKGSLSGLPVSTRQIRPVILMLANDNIAEYRISKIVVKRID